MVIVSIDGDLYRIKEKDYRELRRLFNENENSPELRDKIYEIQETGKKIGLIQFDWRS